jgi:hypothetical protein
MQGWVGEDEAIAWLILLPLFCHWGLDLQKKTRAWIFDREIVSIISPLLLIQFCYHNCFFSLSLTSKAKV